jgi:hypothetical protein
MLRRGQLVISLREYWGLDTIHGIQAVLSLLIGTVRNARLILLNTVQVWPTTIKHKLAIQTPMSTTMEPAVFSAMAKRQKYLMEEGSQITLEAKPIRIKLMVGPTMAVLAALQ